MSKGTSNRAVLAEAIAKVRSDTGNNGTKLYDALEYAYQSLRRIPGRKAIILFSDGDDTWSKATIKSTLCAVELRFLIYPIHWRLYSTITFSMAAETRSLYKPTTLRLYNNFCAVAENCRQVQHLLLSKNRFQSKGADNKSRVRPRPTRTLTRGKNSIYRP